MALANENGHSMVSKLFSTRISINASSGTKVKKNCLYLMVPVLSHRHDSMSPMVRMMSSYAGSVCVSLFEECSSYCYIRRAKDLGTHSDKSFAQPRHINYTCFLQRVWVFVCRKSSSYNNLPTPLGRQLHKAHC